MKYFYDTCALLNKLDEAFEEKFYISSITLREIEDIKNSSKKSEEVKYAARHLSRLLLEKEDSFKVIPYNIDLFKEFCLNEDEILFETNDDKILMTALFCAISVYQKTGEEIVFATSDLCCYHLGKSLAARRTLFKVEFFQKKEKIDTYKGFVEIELSDEEVAALYGREVDLFQILEKRQLILLENEYLFLKDSNKAIIDSYCYNGGDFRQLTYQTFESKMFGKVKPKDKYQNAAMDMLRTNQLIMIRGSAGTGKSWLSFNYLFDKLERHEIDKIIIFCNTVATMGSAKLGYYPGSKDDKLLDSQIGNLLNSKLGDKFMVDKLMAEGKLVLLPMSDIRGYDTTGMKAGIYISEAQNMDIELMRLALQRIGEDSFCIIDGDDTTQVDANLYEGRRNGMKRVSEVFRGESCYGELTLQSIYRSKIAEIAQRL